MAKTKYNTIDLVNPADNAITNEVNIRYIFESKGTALPKIIETLNKLSIVKNSRISKKLNVIICDVGGNRFANYYYKNGIKLNNIDHHQDGNYKSATHAVLDYSDELLASQGGSKNSIFVSHSSPDSDSVASTWLSKYIIEHDGKAPAYVEEFVNSIDLIDSGGFNYTNDFKFSDMMPQILNQVNKKHSKERLETGMKFLDDIEKIYSQMAVKRMEEQKENQDLSDISLDDVIKEMTTNKELPNYTNYCDMKYKHMLSEAALRRQFNKCMQNKVDPKEALRRDKEARKKNKEPEDRLSSYTMNLPLLEKDDDGYKKSSKTAKFFVYTGNKKTLACFAKEAWLNDYDGIIIADTSEDEDMSNKYIMTLNPNTIDTNTYSLGNFGDNLEIESFKEHVNIDKPDTYNIKDGIDLKFAKNLTSKLTEDSKLNSAKENITGFDSTFCKRTDFISFRGGTNIELPTLIKSYINYSNNPQNLSIDTLVDAIGKENLVKLAIISQNSTASTTELNDLFNDENTIKNIENSIDSKMKQKENTASQEEDINYEEIAEETEILDIIIEDLNGEIKDLENEENIENEKEDNSDLEL